MNVIDLFAGPGGWDVAARRLGIDPLGFELDAAAIQTRNAAGLRTIVDRDGGLDVATLNPRVYGPVDGLIASPPCQAFSAAGKGKGRADRDIIELCANDLADGFDSREALLGALLDHRSLLVVEPLRWALDLRPRWLAFEQVPPVLPLWELFAPLLEEVGYSTWTGCLQAEMFGVPQTRKRAFLLARLDGHVSAPVPTHSRYHPRDPQRLDPGVLPWVSMAQALGWDATGSLRSNYGTGGDARNRGERALDEPAFTVTTKIDRNQWVHMAAGVTGEGRPRTLDKPAGTVTGKGTGYWVCDPKKRRVTVQEAAVLQSFPVHYQWRGRTGKQFEQVGNAVPPGLALAVLEAVSGVVALPEELAA